MENEILIQLEQQEAKIDSQTAQIDELTKMVKSLRNYYRFSAAITFIFFILPLIGLLFAIPWITSILSTAYTLPKM
jgi:hypothetical protein